MAGMVVPMSSRVRKSSRTDIDVAEKRNFVITKLIKRKEDLDEKKQSSASMVSGNTTNLSSGHPCFAENLELANCQARTTLSLWDWAPKFFTCTEGSLMNIADIIQDHLIMFGTGAFHRDLSDGNIIMQPQPPEIGDGIWDLVTQTAGKLIDIDHAKATTTWKTVGKIPPSMTVQLHTQLLIQLLDLVHKVQITSDAVTQALTFVNEDMTSYCCSAVKFDVLKSDNKGKRTAEDFGWNDVGEQPDFDYHTPDVVKPTGTIPFISHRFMRWEPDANHGIHDIESLFWVLIYICLISETGGGHRRKDLSDDFEGLEEPEEPKTLEKPEDIEKLEKEREERERRIKRYRNLITDTFYSNRKLIGSEKQYYFRQNEDEYFEHLLEHIHIHFDPLKDLLRRWRNVLILGYTFKAYEYHRVHHYILKIIEDTLEGPDVKNEDRNTPVVQHELAGRAEEDSFICNAQGNGNFSSSANPPSTPPPIIPPSASQAQTPQSASPVPQAAPSRATPRLTATTGTPTTNCPRSHVSTPEPTPNCHPTSLPTNCLSNVVPASVPTTPGPSRASSSNPTPIVPRDRQAPTSPKMPLLKKARKE